MATLCSSVNLIQTPYFVPNTAWKEATEFEVRTETLENLAAVPENVLQGNMIVLTC